MATARAIANLSLAAGKVGAALLDHRVIAKAHARNELVSS